MTINNLKTKPTKVIMFKNLDFESTRLKTARLNEEDAPILFQIYSDVEAMKYRGSKPMKNIDDAFKTIAEQFTVNNHISKLRLGIRLKTDNQLIGTLLLVKDDNLKLQYEIGFSFGKAHWGKGYGQETLGMVEKQIKTYEDIEAIRAWCIKENLASIRIFEKAGFSEIEQNQFSKSRFFVKKIKNL